MFKVPTNEDTPHLARHRGSHELPHHQGINPRDEEGTIGTSHHAIHAVSLPVDDSASTLNGDLTEEKCQGPQNFKGNGDEEIPRGENDIGIEGEGINTPSTEQSSVDENDKYPEGGLQAWLVVLGSFCLLFAALGIMNTIGTFQAHLSEHDLKHYSEGATGWIFGTHAFLAFLCGLQIGPIFDKRGPRELVLVGSIGLVLTLFLMSICKQYWHYFLVFGVLGGVSVSLLFTPAVASVGHWFKVKRATATGLAMTGGSIGGIVFPLVFQKLIPMIGFPWACRIVGFIQLALLIIANITVKSRLKPLPDAKASIDLAALKEPTFALTTFGVFLIEWGIFVPIAYLTSFAIHVGIEEGFAYQLLAIFNAGSVFGRWLPNYVADKWGRFNVMIITSAFCVVTILGLWLPSETQDFSLGKSKGMLITFAVLYGFGSGSGIGLTPVCVGQICRTEDYGKRYGTCYSLASFASLTGVPIAGAILSKYGSYTGLIWFDAGSYIGATIMFAAARIAGRGWGLTTIY